MLMSEKYLKLILDGSYYKGSYTKDGKQQKITIGNEKSDTLLSVRNSVNEMEELIDSKYNFGQLNKMFSINADAEKCGYNGKVIKFSNKSIELVMRMLYPEEYNDWNKANQNNEQNKTQGILSMSPLEILNIGCTATGKTRFILGVILKDKALRNFAMSLTSMKETTACMIVYHINSNEMNLQEGNDYSVSVEIKNREELKKSIEMLIVEAAEEYIETLKNKAKESISIEEVKNMAVKAVSKRLEMNCDKTFGLGQNKTHDSKAQDIEEMLLKGMVDFFGDSKSISRVAEKDDYILRQLLNDFKENQIDITNDDIFAVLNQYDEMRSSPFKQLANQIELEIMNNMNRFHEDYGISAKMGEFFSVQGYSEDDWTLGLVSHIFGNKSKQRENTYYTIETLVKSADIYFKVPEMSTGREVILTDSVGINQGQKDSSRLKEIATNRVQEAIQRRKPDIIFYHTRLNTNDDYMLDIVKNLNMQGFGKRTFVISGRLDTVFADYIEGNGLELSEVGDNEFDSCLKEIQNSYITSDTVTLGNIIGDNYYLCDKTNQLKNKFTSAEEYSCRSVFDKILDKYSESRIDTKKYTDEEFINMLKRNTICGNVYRKYLKHVEFMIPLDYNKMRWNTLQKAIEVLYTDGYGFDTLYPALNLKTLIAEELSCEENELAMKALYMEDIDAIKRRFLMEVAETAQIVLVTEYRSFMFKLIKMRYDVSFRTDLSTSMTNDRKYNLQRLYKTCLQQDGLYGDYKLLIVFHIAWLHTQDFFNQQYNENNEKE